MSLVRTALFICVIVFSQVPAFAEKIIWKREFVESNCVEDIKPAEGEGDSVLYKCTSKFGPPMWRVFYEGTRSAYGFGQVQNFANYLLTTRRGNWPVEWGGVMQGNKFVARVAIARFNFSEEGATANKSALMVFRLLPDGTSCVLTGSQTGAGENLVARAMAQNPKTPCIGKIGVD